MLRAAALAHPGRRGRLRHLRRERPDVLERLVVHGFAEDLTPDPDESATWEMPWNEGDDISFEGGDWDEVPF